MTRLLTTFRSPLELAPVRLLRQPSGLSLEEMAHALDLPPEWWQPGRGIITVDGHMVPRAYWRGLRPKAGVTEVRFLFALHGGGGGEGGKNGFALIASLALLAATGFVSGGGLAGIFGSGFAAGTIGANLAAAGIGLAGNALLGALAAPAAPGAAPTSALDATRGGAASIDGNVLAPDAPIPRVVGTRKIFPPFAAEPLIYFDGDDEMVEALAVLSGPHSLTDIRLNNAPVDDMANVEVETRTGFAAEPPLTLVTRQSRSEQVGVELRPQQLREDGLTVDDAAEGGWEPGPYVIATREAPDEVWLGMVFAQGLSISGGTTNKLRVPLRLRVRPIGEGAWTNLPELHFVGAALKPVRLTIKLRFSATPLTSVLAAQSVGFVEARIVSPDQTLAPAGGGWTAAASFDDGSGDNYLIATNYATTAVRSVQMDGHTASIWLDTADFPPGQYEVEVTRGLAVRDSNYAAATYQVSGSVWNLFGARGTGTLQVAQAQGEYLATLGMVRASSIWNEGPVTGDGLAQIALRARNRNLGPLSTVAAGLVPDWDGTAWTGAVATSNPAPHLRDVLRGSLTSRPVPAEVVDDAELVAWRTACIAASYQINGVIEGGTVAEALVRMAAAGFAVPRMSNVWGVVRARDTSAEAPVHIFSPRNSRGFGFVREFAEIPEGIRASFRDANRDYIERQITWPPNAARADLESRRYDDLVAEADVIRRVKFELAEQHLRAVRYSLTAPAEAVPVQRGDLVACQFPVFNRHAGAGRVVDRTENGSGAVTTITIDALVPIVNEPGFFDIGDWFAIEDWFAIGLVTHVGIQGADGTGPLESVAALSNASGEASVLTLATPAATTGIFDGAQIVVGPATTAYERFIVAGIARAAEFEAEITLVDEAPALMAGH